MSGRWNSDQPLWKALRAEKKDTLLFTGVNTDQCVQGTLVDAYNVGWNCIPIDDCCGTTTVPAISPFSARGCRSEDEISWWDRASGSSLAASTSNRVALVLWRVDRSELDRIYEMCVIFCSRKAEVSPLPRHCDISPSLTAAPAMSSQLHRRNKASWHFHASQSPAVLGLGAAATSWVCRAIVSDDTASHCAFQYLIRDPFLPEPTIGPPPRHVFRTQAKESRARTPTKCQVCFIDQGPRSLLSEYYSILLISPANEILLLHRVRTSSSFPSAHVFPGRNLSASQDGEIPSVADPRRHIDGPAYRLGAIRECFEESGILLAKRNDGSDAILEVAEDTRQQARKDIHAGNVKFIDWVKSLGGVVDTGMLNCAMGNC